MAVVAGRVTVAIVSDRKSRELRAGANQAARHGWSWRQRSSQPRAVRASVESRARSVWATEWALVVCGVAAYFVL